MDAHKCVGEDPGRGWRRDRVGGPGQLRASPGATLIGVALAVVASLAWGTADFLGGRASRRLSPLEVLLASQPVGAVLALGVWLVVAAGTEPPAAGELLAAAGAGMCVMAGVGFLYRAMLTGALGIVATIAALGVLLPVLVGLFDGERPSVVAVIGIGFAIVAAVLVAGHSSGWRDSGVTRASIGLALFAALGFGGFFVLMDEAAGASVGWATFVARAGAISVLATAAAVSFLRGGLGGWRRPPRSEWPPLVGIAAFDLGGTIAFAHATTLGLLPLVAAIASLHSVVTIALAHAFVGEQIRGNQRYGVLLALVGVALISSQG